MLVLDTDHDKAFRQFKPEIDAKYSAGQFVAIDDGQVC